MLSKHPTTDPSKMLELPLGTASTTKSYLFIPISVMQMPGWQAKVVLDSSPSVHPTQLSSLRFPK